jgi:hypothetical protein
MLADARIMRILSAWAVLAGHRVWLCIPAIAYALVALVWHCNGTDNLTGDEEYYLIVAESIVGDFDLDVSNNLPQHGCSSPGWRESHCIERPHGWFSIHSVGLSALLALPWKLCGPLGVRLTMAALCGLAAALLCRVIERIWMSPPNSSAIGIALALGMPFLAASSQIYSDLLAGLVLLFAADCATSSDRITRALGWREGLLSAGLAFLPWLHIKYAAAAIVALGWFVDATRRLRPMPTAALAASLALLGWYNNYAFGKPTGPYGGDDGLAIHLNNLVVFFGLHFDQSQGMFLQQPLLLLGLVGLGPMWRASRRTFLWWLLTYAAAIVPNALHPNWYGGYSFVGRFGSTNVLLWAMPVAYGARTVFRDGSYLPRVLAAFSLVCQAVLADSWLWVHESRFNRSAWERGHAECAWAYNSIYPALIKTYLPYWQPFAGFWHYPANLSVLILAAGATTSGWLWQGRKRQAVQCLAAAALLAISWPLVAGIQLSPGIWEGDTIRGYTGSSDGKRHVAEEGRDEPGLLAKTPDLFLAPGKYRVAVDYQADGDAGCIGAVMFHNHASTTPLYPVMSPSAQRRQDVSSFCISKSECKRPSCVAVWYTGRGKISVARMSIEKVVR